QQAQSEQSVANQHPSPAQSSEGGNQAVAENELSQAALLGRLEALEKQVRQSRGEQLSPNHEVLFEHARGLTQDAGTPDSRRAVAQRIDDLESWIKHDKPEEEQIGGSDFPSQEALLERVNMLEAKCQKQTGMKLSPTVVVLLAQARSLIQQQRTP